LTVRESQMAAFPKAVEKNLECRLCAHVTRLWPGRAEAMGEAAVRRWCRLGIERAAGFGIEAEYEVSRFVDLMFMLGRDFDTDPARPWAAAILQAGPIAPAVKMDKLFEWAERELTRRAVEAHPDARGPGLPKEANG